MVAGVVAPPAVAELPCRAFNRGSECVEVGERRLFDREQLLGTIGNADLRLLEPVALVQRGRLRQSISKVRAISDAAHLPIGTSARVVADFPVPVAGKTGTAQAPQGSDHSLVHVVGADAARARARSTPRTSASG
jgi:hypothetical protein